jgi:anti-sigma factor RsiW
MHPTWNETLTRYLEGTLCPEEEAQLLTHLSGCEACRNLLLALRESVHETANADPSWTGGAALPRTRAAPPGRVVRQAGAAALILLLGIVAGRLSVGTGSGYPGAPSEAAGPSHLPYAISVAEHVARAVPLLAGVEESSTHDVDAVEVLRERARSLLASTRLLIDSPAAENQGVLALLLDLELVLAQLATLSPEEPDWAGVAGAMGSLELMVRLRGTVEAASLQRPGSV